MNILMSWQTVSLGAEDTQRLGELLGRQLSGGEVIELRADLGGGKTTFMKGLASGLGCKDTVSSPSFTLKNIYKAPNGLEVHHFDFYRLSEPGILADQLGESLSDTAVITAVEWSDIVQDVLPNEHLVIELKPAAGNTDERQVTIDYPESASVMISKVQTEWNGVRP